MKSFAEMLTPEQKEALKNWYFWKDKKLTKLADIDYDQPTVENFKVIYVNEGKINVATIKDIHFYAVIDDFNFYIGGDGDYFDRNDTPEEVVEFLDKALNKAQYKKEE